VAADITSMPPPDAPPPRAGTGADEQVELAGGTEAQGTPHDPASCRTCGGSAPWTEERRNEAAILVLVRGRRVCDLPVAS
jgi:hypothetical protein